MAKMLTIRDIVGSASQEMGISQIAPTQIMGAKDSDVVQMNALMRAVADELLDDEPYQTDLSDGMWVLHVSGPENGTTDSRVIYDTDIILFDGRLAVMGVKYRFKKEKGFEFGEDMRDFYNRVNKLAHRKNARVIDRDTDEGRQI